MPRARTVRKRQVNRPKIALRAQKLERRANVATLPPVVNRPGMNQWETRVANALDDLKIQYIAQSSVLGGNVLGGARLDFLLPAYMIDLEVSGPFHGTSEGRARDLLRNLGVQKNGYTVVKVYLDDLPNIHQVLRQIIGRAYSLAPFGSART